MQRTREILSGTLLIIMGILWGHLCITEFLACPEWWFIGVNALLFGAGVYAIRFLPESCRLTAPGLLLTIVLTLGKSDLYSILLPLVFGMWYGSNDELLRQWRISRIFCGGLMIGGILAGTWNFDTACSAILISSSLLYGGLQISYSRMGELALLSAVICLIMGLEVPQQQLPEKFDPGTTVSAFSLIEVQNRELNVTFLGGDIQSISRSSKAISPAGKTIAVSNLPGAVPKCDMIVVSSLPESGDGGVKALLRSLNPGGVLVMSENLCHNLPELDWFILPGSAGRYAISAPGRTLTIDPEMMDDNLNRHFAIYPDSAPIAGALSGLLVGFKSRKLSIPPPVHKNFLNHLIPALAALAVLAMLWAVRAKKPFSENGRIIINCAGYTMLAALTINTVFAGLPGHPALRCLIMAIAVMWIFRRPVDTAVNSSYTRFAGMLSFVALLASWNGSWVFSLTALVFGGFAFAALDGELCGKRDDKTEPVRFLGIAAGAFVGGWLLYSGFSPLIIFSSVAALRFWSWFRN